MKIEGGCAQKDGRLMIGDLILEVNNQDIRKAAYNDVAFLLKTLAPGKVVLKIGRFKTSASQTSSGTGSKTTSRRNSTTQPQQQQQQSFSTQTSQGSQSIDFAKNSFNSSSLKSTTAKK